MIPRRLVQVWLGDDPPPLRWIQTWVDLHPGWEHHLWRERDIEDFGLQNDSLFRSLLQERIYDAASDVARIEILYRLGGVYVDADSICHRSLEEAPFMQAGFFATREIPPGGSYLVTNAFMGSEPGHRIARRYIDRIAKARVRCIHGGTGSGFCCAWRITGPRALTSVLVRSSDAWVLDPAVFFTRTIKGDPVEGEHYGEHFWSSTGARSPEGWFPAAVSYEEAR